MHGQEDDRQRTAIVTGASNGLGLHCALNLARDRPSWHIVLACRRPLEKAQAAAQRIREETGNPHVEAVELDLADLTSIRRFVEVISARLQAWEDDDKREENLDEEEGTGPLPPLAALVCNAGVQVLSTSQKTKDSFELTFGTNHLGHFLLINLILKHVEKPEHNLRIILVASSTHDPEKKTKIPFPRYVDADKAAFPEQDDDPDKPKDDAATAGRRAYSTSKLCNIMCMYALARELEAIGWDDRVRVAAYDPGLMPGTGLAREYSPALRWVWNNVMPLGTLFFSGWVRSERSGAQLARLAGEDAFEAELNGRYFVPSLKSVKSSKDSYNEELQRELWNSSARLVKLTSDETPFAFSE